MSADAGAVAGAVPAGPACQPDVSNCGDPSAAQRLRVVAIFVILAASALGVTVPYLGGRLSMLRRDGNAFVLIKAFAAGVILATGFVHMFPSAIDSLGNACLGWPSYPWAGTIATFTAIIVQLLEFHLSQYWEGKRQHEPSLAAGSRHKLMGCHGPKHECGETGHAVTTAHSSGSNTELHRQERSADIQDDRHRQPEQIHSVAIAQVLEMGIAFHSVLIGIALGVSPSPCVIRPLLVALTFHQFFEGFALGGCLVQAEFKARAYAAMAFVFSTTTPVGVAIGSAVWSTYNANSPAALGLSGVLDSISAGILIYMALVNLVAVDFQREKLKSNKQLKVLAHFALLGGAALMAVLAIWA